MPCSHGMALHNPHRRPFGKSSYLGTALAHERDLAASVVARGTRAATLYSVGRSDPNHDACIQSRRRSILTSVRLQSPSPQPGGSSPAISNTLFVEPGFVAKTANTWPEQLGSVVKPAIV
jgi:hypothetical protein